MHRKTGSLPPLGFQNLAKGKMFANISARYVQEFNMYSGSQIGTKEGSGQRGSVYGGKTSTGVDRFYPKILTGVL